MSALHALPTLAMTMSIFLFIAAVALLATLVMGISMALNEGLELDSLCNLHIDIGFLLLSSEGLSDFGYLGGLKLVWEDELEHYEKVAELVRLLVVGHTMTFNCLDIIRLDDLTRLVLDTNLFAVQMCQDEIDSGQGFKKRDLLLNQEISTSALELSIGLFLDLDDNITGLDAWILISLPVEDVFLSVGCTLVNLDFNDLLLLNDLLAIASLALIFLADDLALSTAFVARLGLLRVHTRSKLLHNSPHTLSSANAAGSNSTGLASLAFALGADTVSADSDLLSLAIVKVSKSSLNGMKDRLGLLRSLRLATTAAHAKHAAEEIAHVGAATAALSETFLTIVVVHLTLLRV